ncbi:hypothetical protein XANCAGTX0491_001864 [Xanthoria calcicola]
MDELLVPLKTTTKLRSSPGGNVESHLLDSKQQPLKRSRGEIKSPEHALEILSSRPQQEDLRAVLRWLHPSNGSNNGFNVHGQTLLASQIIHTLVNDVLPDYWSLLNLEQNEQSRATMDTMTLILSNVSGISMLTSRLKTLIRRKDAPEGNHSIRDSGQAEALASAVVMLESVLKPWDVVYTIWSRLCGTSDLTRRWLLWKELVALLGSGRVLSTASEAEAILGKSSHQIRERTKLADGSRYCFWLGRNLNRMLVLPRVDEDDARKACVQMLERALTLGHIKPSKQPSKECSGGQGTWVHI